MNNSHDPLTVLHGDELPVQPDPAFAARLRARLESAANLFESQPNRTQGVVMSGTDTAIAELNEPAASTSPRPAALPYLAVANARESRVSVVGARGNGAQCVRPQIRDIPFIDVGLETRELIVAALV